LIDLFGPQSYQPFAIADALLSLKLADLSRLQIRCVDINERVIAHLQGLRKKREANLSILSGVDDSPAHPLTNDYQEYFRSFGRSTGVETEIKVPAEFASRLKKSLKIRPEIIDRITVDRLNIVTERYENSEVGRYDLIIVTNVFPLLTTLRASGTAAWPSPIDRIDSQSRGCGKFRSARAVLSFRMPAG
jgi:chemotaxis methyl-accepting protein methylase